MSSAPAAAANRNQDLSSAVREAEERYIAANPESQRLAQLATRSACPAATPAPRCIFRPSRSTWRRAKAAS